MKRIHIIRFCCALLICLTLFCSCGRKLSQPEYLGNATAQYYEQHEKPTDRSASAWDLYEFGGKIYIGSGDLYNNTGGVPIISYDLKSGKFATESEIDDEQITQFTELDGTLIIPGDDPVGSPNYGNIYTLDDGEWQKNEVLPNAVHCLGIVKHGGKYYAGINALFFSPVCVSNEISAPFEYAQFYKNGKLLEIPDMYERYGMLYSFNGELYARIVYGESDDKLDSREVYKLCGDRFEYYCDTDKDSLGRLDSGLGQTSYEFGGRLYFKGTLRYTDDLMTVHAVTLPTQQYITDIFVADNAIYALGATRSGDEFINTVFSSTDGDNFKTVCSFKYPSAAVSFIKASDGDFYFGIGRVGTKNAQDESKYGDILKLKGTENGK